MHGVWRTRNGYKMELNRPLGFTTMLHYRNCEQLIHFLHAVCVWNQIVTVQLRISIEATGPLKSVPRVIF